MRITWSQHAYNSLSDVLEYSEETFGIRQALKIEEKILESIEKLADFPLMFPVIPEISNNIQEYRKLVISHELSVIYKVMEDEVRIEFVWDIRRSLHNIYYYFYND